MAKKRSKAQKQKTEARHKHKAEMYSIDDIDASSKKTSSTNKKNSQTKAASNGAKSGDDLSRFFGYDVHLIYKDLIRTLVVSGVVFGVLLLIVMYTNNQ